MPSRKLTELEKVKRAMARKMTQVRRYYRPWHKAVNQFNVLNDTRKQLEALNDDPTRP